MACLKCPQGYPLTAPSSSSLADLLSDEEEDEDFDDEDFDDEDSAEDPR